MGAKDTPEQDQKEYGQVQKEEQDAEMLAVTAALEQQNALQVETPASTATSEPQGNVGSAQVGQSALRPGVFQPTSLIQRVPHKYSNVKPQKPVADRINDVGSLWEALTVDPQASEAMRSFARRMLQRG